MASKPPASSLPAFIARNITHLTSPDPLSKGDCSICQEPYDDDDPPIQISNISACTHVFGRKCLETWLSDHNTCPMCRATLYERTRDVLLDMFRGFRGRITMPDLSTIPDPSTITDLETRITEMLHDDDVDPLGAHRRWIRELRAMHAGEDQPLTVSVETLMSVIRLRELLEVEGQRDEAAERLARLNARLEIMRNMDRERRSNLPEDAEGGDGEAREDMAQEEVAAVAAEEQPVRARRSLATILRGMLRTVRDTATRVCGV
jgi:hypothetical protein